MKRNYFVLEDDFDGIIKNQLSGVTSIVKIPTGWTNYVFKVETKHGEIFVFRFPRHGFWAKTLEKEIWFNKFIRDKVNVLTTDLKYYEHDGKGYSVHKYVQGTTMTDAYPKMTLNQKQALAEQIADYVLTLRKLDVSEFELPTFAEFHVELAQVTNDPNFNYKEIFKPLFAHEVGKLCLVHGDLNPGNILLDENFNMLAVLDYAFASLSAGPCDFCVLLARSTMSDFRELVVNAYQQKSGEKIDEKLLDEFIKIRTEVESDYVKYMARCHKDVVLPKF